METFLTNWELCAVSSQNQPNSSTIHGIGSSHVCSIVYVQSYAKLRPTQST
uniref:Uncharacterized protein n=1 Tax=Arundo donax TaxID=35708 RepID=A0A0A8YI39_ARUDO